MRVYISNLDNISKDIDDLNRMRAKLSKIELDKYRLLSRETRKMQFLVAHCMKHDFANKDSYTSISHKNNFVILAVSHTPIGIDIEDASIVRDFSGISELMGFPPPKSQFDFYMNFVKYESEFKIGKSSMKPSTKYYKFERYIIGASCVNSNFHIDFIDYLTGEQLSVPPVSRNNKNDIK